MAIANPDARERRLEVEEQAPLRRILALGGHDFTSRPPDRAVCELMLRLGTERAGGRPRICILPTASGDTSEQIGRFYAAFGERPCEPSDLSLFRLGRRPMALRDHLLAQDLVYVGGGSLVNLLAVWEAHEIGAILSLAWRRGIVLAGQSAGAMCWFEAGITKSSGRPAPAAGLGLLGGSLCVHYNNEPERRAAYLDAVGGGMPGGYGLDDYAGLLWEGEGPPAALTARRGARAYRVRTQGEGVSESALPARFLPAPAPAALREDIAEFRRLKSLRKRAGWLG
jgi:dipeptidase E